MILDGGFARWNDVNLAALRQCRHLLTPEAQAHLDTYEAIRSASLPARLTAFARSQIRRQTFTGNVALLTAIVLRKF